jgi:membrane-associated phospholipid phosphatase
MSVHSVIRVPTRRDRVARLGVFYRALILLAVVSILHLGAVPPSEGQNLSIRDVPLKSWTGFARHWDWTYDALHKLALSGLTGKVVLNTKPMSRREMAWILADIVQRIQENKVAAFDHRTDLQDIVLDLMEEFSPELRALGATGHGIKGEPPQTIEFKPIEFLQFRAGYTSNSATALVNRSGERLDDGLNGRVTSSSWLDAGGVVAAYVQPEYLIGDETNTGRLVEGYVKVRGGPVELVAGREPLWWGPGYRGSMLLSNNSPGIDMVRLRSANQFSLPWVFKDLFGPIRAELFFGSLEKERSFYPRSKVTGGRINLAPFSWLEIGFGREIMFDGDGRPDLDPWEYPRVWVESNREGEQDSKYAGDNRWQIDVSIRLANIGKYIPFTRDAEIYLDFGWDDTCCGTFYVPLKPGAIAGIYLPNLFSSPDMTFRFEYSNTSSFQYTHGTWLDGFIRKGHVISHLAGTAGEDWFFRLTRRVDKKLEVGAEFNLSRRGRTQKGFEFSTKELHRYVGFDMTYRHSPAMTVSLDTGVEWVYNRDFVAGNRDVNLVNLASVTYAFDPKIGTGERATLPRGTMPPVDPPPDTPDPDQILSWEYAGKVFKDSGRLVTSPLRWEMWDWLIAGGVLAATGGAMLLDHEARGVALENRTHTSTNIANFISNFALIAPAVGTAANYVVGQVWDNERAKQRAADAVEATLLSNALLVYPTKFLLGRGRPADNQGAQYYQPFHINGSLPSFHVAQAFTAASVISAHWDNPWVSALAYSTASSVGWARINLDKHWLSDVVLGAAIGTAVGKAVVYLNRQRRDSPVSVVPLASPQMWGAAVQVKY